MNDVARPALFAGLDEGLRSAANHAAQLLQAGDSRNAGRRFERLLRRAPDNADLLRLAGMAQRLAGNAAQAVTTLTRARSLVPDDPLVASSLGLALLDDGQTEAGLAELQRACALVPDSVPFHFNLGKAFVDHRDPVRAIKPLRRAIELQPTFASAQRHLAWALAVTGHVDEAARHYRSVLELEPAAANAKAWVGLAQLKSGVLGNDDIKAMRAVLARGNLSDDDRIAIGHALGEACHDAGQYDEAFAAWAEANRLRRAQQPWDAARFSAHVDRVLTHEWPEPPAPSSRPPVIFIVGLPRSGTTLVEQVLAMHPEVVAGGELDTVGHLVLPDAASGEAYPHNLASLTTDQWREMGREYLQRAREEIDTDGIFTDKRPGNWHFTPAIFNMLPDARMVICRRDPLATAFSCWRQHFGPNGQLFSTDFESTARYWHDFDRAARHWQEVYPKRVFELQHDALVKDTENTIRRLLAFCDLPWDPACLHPERGTDAVYTISTAQVRRPIGATRSSVEHYAEALEPLRQALGRPD